jgi:hypothetical protein
VRGTIRGPSRNGQEVVENEPKLIRRTSRKWQRSEITTCHGEDGVNSAKQRGRRWPVSERGVWLVMLPEKGSFPPLIWTACMYWWLNRGYFHPEPQILFPMAEICIGQAVSIGPHTTASSLDAVICLAGSGNPPPDPDIVILTRIS